jgi:hypothetical protein
MASQNFTHLADHLARGLVNYAGGDIKGLLVSAAPTEAQLDNWVWRSDVTIEAVGTGYEAGGFAVTAAIGSVDVANNQVGVTFAAATPAYAEVEITAVGCILYQSTGDAGADPLLHYVDFGSEVVVSGGPLIVTFTTPFNLSA